MVVGCVCGGGGVYVWGCGGECVSVSACVCKGRHQNPHSRMTKKMLVKHWLPVCNMYVTSHKKPFVPSVRVSDYYVMYRQRPKSVL